MDIYLQIARESFIKRFSDINDPSFIESKNIENTGEIMQKRSFIEIKL